MRLARFVVLLTLLGGVLGPTGGAAASTSAAVVKVTPNVGPPTLPIKVQGKGYGTSELVLIQFDTLLIATVNATATGRFSTNTTVPLDATPGAHTIKATGQTSHLTASTGFTVRTNWSKFHFDLANTGFNPYENVLSVDNVAGLVEQWSQPTHPGFDPPDPVVSGGIVYSDSSDGVVHAKLANGGSEIWSFDTGGTMDGTAPDVSGGSVYVANESEVYALTAGRGQLIWNRNIGDGVAFIDNVAGGTVYARGSSFQTGFAYALNASNGDIIWSTGLITGRLAPVANGLVYYGTKVPCSVTALNASTGTQAWVVDLCGELVVDQQAGAVADGVLFGQFYGMNALDASTGAVDWHNELAGDVTTDAPAIANGLVYTANGSLTAFNEATGSVVWADTLGGSVSSPAIANGVVYVGTNSGTLRAYDALSGALLWESRDFGFVVGSPAVSDGVVYVGTSDGAIHAFGLP